MPWLETSLMDQRMQFIADVERDLWPVTELAQRFGISRKTAYKWIDRYEEAGPTGLTDRSRRPQHCPHETPQAVVEAVLEGPRYSCPKRRLNNAVKTVPIDISSPTLPALVSSSPCMNSVR